MEGCGRVLCFRIQMQVIVSMNSITHSPPMLPPITMRTEDRSLRGVAWDVPGGIGTSLFSSPVAELNTSIAATCPQGKSEGVAGPAQSGEYQLLLLTATWFSSALYWWMFASMRGRNLVGTYLGCNELFYWRRDLGTFLAPNSVLVQWTNEHPWGYDQLSLIIQYGKNKDLCSNVYLDFALYWGQLIPSQFMPPNRTDMMRYLLWLHPLDLSTMNSSLKSLRAYRRWICSFNVVIVMLEDILLTLRWDWSSWFYMREHSGLPSTEQYRMSSPHL